MTELFKDGASPPAESDPTAVRSLVWGVFFVALMYSCLMLVNLPGSVNHIVNGDQNKTSPTAQTFYTACFFMKHLASFLFAPLVGELGDVKGRKLMCLAAGTSYTVCAAVSFLAHIALVLPLHAVAQWLLGMFAPFSPTAMAYLGDVSAPADFPKNYARYAMFGASAAGLGLIIAATASILGMLELTYALALFFGAVCIGIMVVKMPDKSPPKEARKPKVECKRATPFLACGAICAWKWRLKNLWLQMLLANAGSASFIAWYVNFFIFRYEMTVAEAAIWTFVLLLFAAAGVRILLPRLGLRKGYLMGILADYLFVIAFIVGPATRIVPWASLVIFFWAAPQGAALSGMYYGLAEPSERGTLAGGLKVSDAIGRMLGVPLGGLMLAAYMNGSFPIPPALSNLILNTIKLVLFLVGENRYRTEYGTAKGVSESEDGTALNKVSPNPEENLKEEGNGA